MKTRLAHLPRPPKRRVNDVELRERVVLEEYLRSTKRFKSDVPLKQDDVPSIDDVSVIASVRQMYLPSQRASHLRVHISHHFDHDGEVGLLQVLADVTHDHRELHSHRRRVDGNVNVSPESHAVIGRRWRPIDERDREVGRVVVRREHLIVGSIHLHLELVPFVVLFVSVDVKKVGRKKEVEIAEGADCLLRISDFVAVKPNVCTIIETQKM